MSDDPIEIARRAFRLIDESELNDEQTRGALAAMNAASLLSIAESLATLAAPPEPQNIAKPECGNVSPEGRFCALAIGHPGLHASYDQKVQWSESVGEAPRSPISPSSWRERVFGDH